MELRAILPELVLAGCCLGLVPMAGLVRGRWRDAPILVSAAALAASIVLTARMLDWEAVTVFHGTYAVDGFAHIFKLVILGGALLSLPALWSYFRHHEQIKHAPPALLFTTLGGIGLVSSVDLAMIVLFLQMLSMGIYVLAALVRDDVRGLEAGLKYFIYGAAALAVMAYGLTFLYGMSGTLNLHEMGPMLKSADPSWIVLAGSMIVIGYGFEMTMVPFHPWSPDVLDGSRAPVSGFISVVPKVAAVGALLRFLLIAFQDVPWQPVLAVFAAVTMTFGNLVALRQRSLKRLLAYSTIAQTGYVLMAVAVAGRGEGAIPAAVYYLAAYTLMNLGAFAVTSHVERTTGSDAFDVVRGLGRSSPAASVVFTLALLSLAGIPPLAGFAGKVFLLEAALNGGMTWLAVVAAANMTLGLFYYARVIGIMYMVEAVAAPRLPARFGLTCAYLLTSAGTLALGIFPGPFRDVAAIAVGLLGR